MSIELISEDHYSDYMNETVLPYLEARKHSGFIERNPGESVYYETFRADHPKASVVIIHGFSSSLPKFYETAWYFLRENMNVFLLQQRGHGLSFRGVSDRSLIWISDYKDLILDLRHFMETIVKADAYADAKTQILFRENKIYIGLYNSKDLFEGRGEKTQEGYRSSCQKDLQYITDFLDIMRLNTALFHG